MPLQSSLMQTNGTLDSWPAYKNRILPVNSMCALPYVMCSKTQTCRPGSKVVSKGNNLFCCPTGDYSNTRCTWVGFGLGSPDIQIHPQTHNNTTYQRTPAVHRRAGGGGAVHRNVVQPASSGPDLLSIALLGGAGYVGYKLYKKYKKKP